MPFVDPSSLAFTTGIVTEVISIISAIVFAAMFLERRSNSKIQRIKDQVCTDLEELEQNLKEYIEQRHEISKERTKYINDTLEKIEKQIERLENMSFSDYYKKFYYPSTRRNGDDVLPSK